MRGRPEPNRKEEFNVNDKIKSDPVRLIGPEGEQVGIVGLADALSKASDANLDLVEVSPQANPPVCKILDYGKFKFQQQKKAAEARKRQQTITVKEVTLRPRTEEHDYQVKLKNITKFLSRGDKVKVTLRFRGREMAHQELGGQMLSRIEEDTVDIAQVESRPRMDGRFMVMVLAPAGKK